MEFKIQVQGESWQIGLFQILIIARIDRNMQFCNEYNFDILCLLLQKNQMGAGLIGGKRKKERKMIKIF